ncbi:hypothetical protein [Streptomyces sp. NPDC048644]|uniref:hypothetical protein n=1 Tax=Streptomyces sp. NPDC048644 TaxID=3365582 RepID=UPI003710F843
MNGYEPAAGGTPLHQVPAAIGPPELLHEAGAHLGPGERLLAALPAAVDDLLPPRLPRKHRARKGTDAGPGTVVRVVAGWFFPSSWGWIFAGDSLFTLLGRGYRRLYRALRRPTHGGSWSGGYPGSAGGLLVAVRNNTPEMPLGGENDDFVLAVTTHRLLVLSEPWGIHERVPARQLAAYPRGTCGRRREAHPARQKYRTDLEFADATWIALRMKTPQDAAALTAVLG